MLNRNSLPGFVNHRNLNGGCPAGWIVDQPASEAVELGEPRDIDLCAVIATWKDWDIIGASVRNCFEQGCARVLILDNDSRDDTVERAKAAGAEIAKVYATEYYDDDLLNKLRNDTIKCEVERSKRECWWIALDADEFPVVPGTLKQYLSRLPQHIRTVGFDAIDLYPTGMEYVVGEYPWHCYDMGWRRSGGFKRYGQHCGHWKHPVVQYNGLWDIGVSRGGHCPSAPKSMHIVEPDGMRWIFHAPLRRREDAERRLKALCNGRSEWDDHVTGKQGAIKRWSSLKAIYEGRWDAVDIPHTQMYGRAVVGIALYPWRVIAPELNPRSLPVCTATPSA